MKGIQRPKGTHDILPDESRLWVHLENTARQCFHQANYGEVRPPVFEYTELFSRGVGEGTDIVSKEMYTFTKEERSLTLRPECTASVVRAYMENGLDRTPKPVKLFYIGPMFRYERPQEGRQRQFHQVGIELFGLDTPASDAEVIVMAWRFLEAVGLGSLSLEINNVGSGDDRVRFREGLKTQLAPHLSQLCDNCQRRFETNPLRMLDCKVDSCQALYASLETWLKSDALSEKSHQELHALEAVLTGLNIPYRHNPRLVRGLDYYTGTVFEITTTALGAQNAVCGGGRYNHLVETFGGQPVPAVGWAMGMERLIHLMKKLDVAVSQAESPLVVLAADEPVDAFVLAESLRHALGNTTLSSTGNVRVEVDLSDKRLNKKIEAAAKRGTQVLLLQGSDEKAQGGWQLKNLNSGEQTLVKTDALCAAVLAALASVPSQPVASPARPKS